MKKKAIILFSGGLDSTTCLAIAKAQDYACYALSFEYGQKHSIELIRARNIAESMGVIEHKILDLPIGKLGGSSLTDPCLAVADYKEGVIAPASYVPARNTIFLTFALAWGEVIGADDIFIGVNQVDYSGYPDCRPSFLAAFEHLARVGTKAGEERQFKIHAPLLQMSKADIILEGMRLGIDYSKTLSCYRPDQEGRACGNCDSCTYRKKGFAEANIPDTTLYT